MTFVWSRDSRWCSVSHGQGSEPALHQAPERGRDIYVTVMINYRYANGPKGRESKFENSESVTVYESCHGQDCARMNRRQRGSIDEDSKMKRKGETDDHSGAVLNYI